MPSIRKLLVEELVADGRVTARIRVELYLQVALELRRCSILELPAALPDGAQLGRQVDEACREQYEVLVRETDPVKKWPLIKDLKRHLQSNFREKVLKSQSCIALAYWEGKLGLRRYSVALRPTIHEIYIFKKRSDWWTVRQLAKTRLQIREESLKSLHREFIAFPEEFSPNYVRETGRLLSYPECCIEEYVKDRMSGTVVEIRLSGQLRTLRCAGSTLSPYPFFIKNFYPCRPNCQEAEKKGQQFYETLNTLSPRLGEIYHTCLLENMRYIENYEACLEAHRSDLERRLAGFSPPF